jgi:hypothetical protein
MIELKELPKVLEDIIVDYKVDLENTYKSRKKFQYILQDLKHIFNETFNRIQQYELPVYNDIHHLQFILEDIQDTHFTDYIFQEIKDFNDYYNEEIYDNIDYNIHTVYYCNNCGLSNHHCPDCNELICCDCHCDECRECGLIDCECEVIYIDRY